MVTKKPQKGFKIIHRIMISKDILSLNKEKVMNDTKQDKSIYVEDNKILLKASQIENNIGIQKKLDVSISIYNDKINSDIVITVNDNYTNFIKNVNTKIECTDKIRYMILIKVKHCLIKVCKKRRR